LGKHHLHVPRLEWSLDTHSEPDCYDNTHSNANAYTYTHCHPDSDANAYSDSYPYPKAYCHTDSDINAHSDTDTGLGASSDG
jgi:hypothetical protein